MTKMLKTRDREEQKEIYETLDKIDNYFLSALRELRSIRKQFLMKRDQNLVKKLMEISDYGANHALLLKGRTRRHELGFPIFMKEEMLEFNLRRKGLLGGGSKYIKLTETNYRGKKFKKFMVKDVGAIALIKKINGRQTIFSVLIPRSKKNMIIN